MPTRIGNVTRERYEELVAEGRQLVAEQTRIQFRLGEDALEIEPLQDPAMARPPHLAATGDLPGRRS